MHVCFPGCGNVPPILFVLPCRFELQYRSAIVIAKKEAPIFRSRSVDFKSATIGEVVFADQPFDRF